MNDSQPSRKDTKFVGHHVSSGGFIFHHDSMAKKVSVLLIKNKRGEYWIPKGHIEEGEDQVAAAFREIAEEVGLDKDQLEYIGLSSLYKFSVTEDDGNLNTKDLYMNVFGAKEKWPLKLEQGNVGVMEGEWFLYEIALEKILPYSKNELIKARVMFDAHLAAK